MGAVAGWYHCSVKPVKRSVGRSVIAAAAYRIGDCLHDRLTGDVYDYTRRSGVVTSFTLAPEHAPAWAYDPEMLWNAAERAETRRNSQVGRECELALPASVSAQEREAIATVFAKALVDRYGVGVTVALHEPSRDGDERNFHAHILMTTRRVEVGGLGAKTRVLDDMKSGPKEVLYLRELACNLINVSLERSGLEERVDHRSFEDRGIDQEPTEHLGPDATEMERRGQRTNKGDANREVTENNGRMDDLVRTLAQIDAEIADELERQMDERYGPLDPGSHDNLDEHPAEGGGGRFGGIAQTAAEEEEQLERDASPFEEQIRADGEIHHDGLAMTWWEHAANFAQWVYEAVRNFVKGAWQMFVEEGRADEERSKDDPDMTR